jgi:hypothetical protein
MEDEAMIEATGPTSHLAEIDAWAVKSMSDIVWRTNASEDGLFIERDEDGDLLLKKRHDGIWGLISDDTTLAELLTVCRVLGIPLEVEGAK